MQWGKAMKKIIPILVIMISVYIGIKSINEKQTVNGPPEQTNLQPQNDTGKSTVKPTQAPKDDGSIDYEKRTGGLPLAVKKRIFYNLVKEEDRLYNDGLGNVAARARSNIAKEYDLDEEIISWIGIEGLNKDWPMPPL